jgi:transposase
MLMDAPLQIRRIVSSKIYYCFRPFSGALEGIARDTCGSLRHGCIFRDGETIWTLKHRRCINAQRLDDSLAQLALAQMLIHLDGIERQLDTLDAQLERSRSPERWSNQVKILTRFRGISTLTALGLFAEIGDFVRFSHPRELTLWLGITPSEYSPAISNTAGTSPRPAAVRPHGDRHRAPTRRACLEGSGLMCRGI